MSPELATLPCLWDDTYSVLNFVYERALELSYTAWDLEPFARDLGYDGPPFRWDPERRFLLRCELDAAFFHLYGIGRDDVDYIMETFPIVKRKDEAAHGEYRTKRVILEIYDQMSRAADTGQPYRTPHDPPPVELAAGADEAVPATVTPLRPQDGRGDERRDRRSSLRQAPVLQPGEAPPAQIAADENRSHEYGVRVDAHDPAPERPAPTVDASPDEAVPSQPPPERRGVATEPAVPDGSHPPAKPREPITKPIPEAPNPYDAALALGACLPDGEKVDREALLADAARELGHPTLTKKVRRVLNKSLNVERNAGRLKTDWEKVWRPKMR